MRETDPRLVEIMCELRDMATRMGVIRCLVAEVAQDDAVNAVLAADEAFGSASIGNNNGTPCAGPIPPDFASLTHDCYVPNADEVDRCGE